MTLTEIPRDRWKRPLIIPLDPEGQPDLSAKLVPYTRVSSMSGALDDKTNLMKWKQRITGLGAARRPDQLFLIQALIAKYDDPLNDAESKKKLNAILDTLDEAGGANVASARGTAWHEFTEALDLGRPLGALSDDVKQRLAEYADKTSHLTVLEKETFVVNDETQTAGTFDTLYGCPDGRARVSDLKTGKDDPNYPLKVCVQVGTYSHGRRYDPVTGERTEIHPDLDKSTGILIHMPDRGTGTQLYSLNLDLGWTAALVAAQVTGIRKWKKADLLQSA